MTRLLHILAPLVLLLLPAGLARAQTDATGFRWERLPDLPMGVVAPAASISGDLLIVTGGIVQNSKATDLVQVMDLTTRTWVRTFRLAQPRYDHKQVTLDDGRVLVFGGRMHDVDGRAPYLTGCEIVDPEHGVSPAAELPARIGRPTASKLDDGRIVAIGGPRAIVYDPARDAWSEPIQLHQRRDEHAAVVIGPASVLVIGGTAMRTFEHVDVAGGVSHYAISPALPMNLDDMAAHRLSDGRVWVIGGQMLNGVTIDRTWLVTLSPTGEPVAVDEGPPLGLPDGISDHVTALTQWGMVIAGGEVEGADRHDKELRTALLLDPTPGRLTVTRLPDLAVPHDDAAAVAWNGTIIVLGGQTAGSILGVAMPTTVSAVELLVKNE